MNVFEAQLAKKALYSTVGKTALSALYPNEFETYMCALELVDANKKSLQYFIFPVNPQAMSLPQSNNTKITKTLGGVMVLSDPTYQLGTVTMNGTFGRSLKALIGRNYLSLGGSGYNFKNFKMSDGFKLAKNTFSYDVKTGYGCCKILEGILQESLRLDEIGPRYLYLYNLAFNQKHVVEVNDFSFRQSEDRNMIWDYSLTLTKVAPLEGFSSMNSRSNIELTVDSLVQRNLSKITSLIGNAMKTNPNKDGRITRQVQLSSSS